MEHDILVPKRGWSDMRLATHTSTAAALAFIFLLFYARDCTSPLTLLIYFLLVVLSNIALDVLGHSWVSYRGIPYPRRNKLHSLPGVLGLGLVFGLPVIIRGCTLLAVGVILGLLLHLAEDIVTEGGIPLFGGRRVKVRRRGWSYDSTEVNRGTIALFLLILVLLWPYANAGPDLPIRATYYIVIGYLLLSFVSV